MISGNFRLLDSQLVFGSCMLSKLVVRSFSVGLICRDFLLEVGHATVADFHCVPVKDLVKHMIFRKLFVEDLKERSSKIGSHILAERRVIPDDVTAAVRSCRV